MSETESTREVVSVPASQVQRGMTLRVGNRDATVVGAVNTSSARRAVTWRFEDGEEDGFVGSPERELRVVRE